MADADISIDDGALNSLYDRIIPPWLQQTKLTPIASLAYQNCPVGKRPDDLGREPAGPPLRDTINTSIDGSAPRFVGYVYAASDHAAAVNNGTQPHLIQAVNVSKLRFVAGAGPFAGSTVYPKAVNHPGTTGQPFLTDAMRVVISG